MTILGSVIVFFAALLGNVPPWGVEAQTCAGRETAPKHILINQTHDQIIIEYIWANDQAAKLYPFFSGFFINVVHPKKAHSASTYFPPNSTSFDNGIMSDTLFLKVDHLSKLGCPMRINRLMDWSATEYRDDIRQDNLSVNLLNYRGAFSMVFKTEAPLECRASSLPLVHRMGNGAYQYEWASRTAGYLVSRLSLTCSLHGSFSRLFGLNDHITRIVSGATGVVQSSENSEQRGGGQNSRDPRWDHHPPSPAGHLLLGYKVGLFALVLLVTFFFVHLGFKAADRGFDFFERGKKARGIGMLGFGVLVACGGGSLLPLGLLKVEGWALYLLP